MLVTIDTLRADHVSSYGYRRPTTPVIDALARRGIRFENAWSSSSWTVPSVVSLLSGLQAPSHGVEHGHLAPGKGLSADALVEQEVIAPQVDTWAELLRAAGYTTFGITANGHLDARFGFAQGFDHYRCVGFAGAERVEEVAREWAGALQQAEPFFLWVHLLDPHAPYTPRRAWLAAHLPGFRGVPPRLRGVVVAQQYADERGITTPASPGFEMVRWLYDGEIAHTDAAVGRLLARAGVGDDDLVVVTADHGEEFLEHGRFGHGFTLYEESLRVPWVLRLPGGRHAGSVVRQPVGAVDVLPTVLDALGLEAPRAAQGRTAMGLVRGEAEAPRDVFAALARFDPLRAHALRRGSWKLLRREATGRSELYDLASDSAEAIDLASKRPERTRELEAALERGLAAQRAQRIEPGHEPLSAEQLRRLEALGYVGARDGADAPR